MTEYRVDAYARVPYAAFIHANSREEAWEIAEKKAKEFSIFSHEYLCPCDCFLLSKELRLRSSADIGGSPPVSS